MPSATTPLAVRGREGGGGGAPSQKTCRSPSIPEPLAEGGFVAKRLLVLLVLVSGLVLPASALAATVHVRVEGKTQTLYGAAEPTLIANTPLDALEAASLAGEFFYHVASTSFGNYVDQIGRYAASG